VKIKRTCRYVSTKGIVAGLRFFFQISNITNMKIKYLVYVILTLTVASLVLFIYLHKQKTIKILSETESESELEWVTYNDGLYNFSFEYKKGDFVGVGSNSESPYIRIRNTHPYTIDNDDSSEIKYIGPTLEYDIAIEVYKKNNLDTFSCEQLIAEYLKLKYDFVYEVSYKNNFVLNNYEVYEIESVRNGGALLFKDRTFCFDRPDYSLLISNPKFDGAGDNVLDHLISSVKFAN